MTMNSPVTHHAAVDTDKPVPYMRQLCKHFDHRLEAEFGDDSGYIQFDAGRCDIDASGDHMLRLTVTAGAEEDARRLSQVVGSHLERFGRRDGLSVTWD
jgi:hypothetical protein